MDINTLLKKATDLDVSAAHNNNLKENGNIFVFHLKFSNIYLFLENRLSPISNNHTILQLFDWILGFMENNQT
jgi:hypothetical protein